MAKEQLTEIRLYLEDSIIQGVFKGTPEEIEAYIKNGDNINSTIVGKTNSFTDKDILSIPIKVLRSNVYQLTKRETPEEFSEKMAKLKGIEGV